MNEDQARELNQSEAVFAKQIDEAESEARDANVIYRSLRRGFLTIGISLAVLLPLALIPSPSDGPVPPTPDNTTINNYQLPTPEPKTPEPKPGELLEIKQEFNLPPTAAAAQQVTIRGVQQLNREWHRSVFKVNDVLWALPDVAFKLKLRSLGGDCLDKKSSCTAEFTLDAPKYLPNSPLNKAFTIGATDCDFVDPSRCISAPKLADLTEQRDALIDGCIRDENPLTPYVLCQFFKISLDPDQDRQDVCLWLRRSVIPESDEQETKPHVAVDIKWQKVDLREDAATGLRDQCTDWSNIALE